MIRSTTVSWIGLWVAVVLLTGSVVVIAITVYREHARLAAIEAAIVPLQEFLTRAGTVTPADVLDRTEGLVTRTQTELSEIRELQCAVLEAVHAPTHALCHESRSR